MANMNEDTEELAAEVRLQTLEEASSEARRLARQWRDEADGTHSSHRSHLLRTWSDAADKVAWIAPSRSEPRGRDGRVRALQEHARARQEGASSCPAHKAVPGQGSRHLSLTPGLHHCCGSQ